MQLCSSLDVAESRVRLEASLHAYVKEAWHVLEPGTSYVDGWHIREICGHLEAVYRHEIDDLLINVPPACMKSLLVNVFFMTWVWAKRPSDRFAFWSYTDELSYRDADKCRRLIMSPWYQARWGHKFTLSGSVNAKERFQNSETGERIATSIGGLGTGEGGNWIVVDDPHKADTARSATKRRNVLTWWKETMPTRQRPPGSGGRIIIMQRLHTMDLSGYVLKEGGWHHLCLPMEYEPKHPHLSKRDPRKKRGQLLWPQMFGVKQVEKLKRGLASEYARAGQLQQKPVPDGGGIIKEPWWRLWEDDRGGVPKCDIRLMSVDTGYTEKTHNDPSGYIMLGRFRDANGQINLILMHAWTGHLDTPDLNDLLEKVALKWKPTRILVENKAAGLPVMQEMRRRLPLWSITAFDPTRYGDKIARAYAVQELIKGPSPKGGDGIVWVPDRPWAAAVIDQCTDFPNGDHDEYVDCLTQALIHLRNAAVIVTPDEPDEEMLRAMDPDRTKPKPLYGDLHK